MGRFVSRSCMPAGLVLALAAMGCEGATGDVPVTQPDPPGPRCPAGEAPLEGGGCLPAGMHPSGCEAGLVPRGGGGCRPAGVEQCAMGFVPDGRGGCLADVPECGAGQMAVVGERRCRAVAPCGSGRWGDLPVDGRTEHVDGAYLGGDSDGSAAKPWVRIQDAVDAAEEGVLVAIAAGSYSEELTIATPSLELAGRCPELVSIEAPAGPGVIVSAPDVRLRAVAITGAGGGVVVDDSPGFAADSVWIHDTGGYGLSLLGSGASALLTGVLVERTLARGIYAEGGQLEVHDSLVRDIVPGPVDGGRGINVRDEPSSGARGSLVLTGSVVERGRELCVMVHASDGYIEGSLVRDCQPAPDGRFGRCINAQVEPSTREAAVLRIEGSVVERCHDGGVSTAGADLEMRGTTIRDVLPNVAAGDRGYCLAVQRELNQGLPAHAFVDSSLLERCHESNLWVAAGEAEIVATALTDGYATEAGHGRGVTVQDDPATQTAGVLRVAHSRIERAYEVGAYAGSSVLSLEGVAIRDVLPVPGAKHGRGISVQTNPETLQPSDFALRWSLVERTHEVGVAVDGSRALIESSIVRDTAAIGDVYAGNGVEVQSSLPGSMRGELTVRWSLVENQVQVGMLLAGSAWIEGTRVRGTKALGGELFGDGVVVLAHTTPDPTAELVGLVVEHNDRAGVAVFGGWAALHATMLECNGISLVRENFEGHPGELSDRELNRCGCEGVSTTCKALEAGGIEPPQPPKDNL